jgi:hypothetical protein
MEMGGDAARRGAAGPVVREELVAISTRVGDGRGDGRRRGWREEKKRGSVDARHDLQGTNRLIQSPNHLYAVSLSSHWSIE